MELPLKYVLLCNQSLGPSLRYCLSLIATICLHPQRSVFIPDGFDGLSSGTRQQF
ncbi:hypothetical protein FIBSPDRAFT_398026 [Athelia psychrophila]|uniref:Uncharacterized protein n=1 Tax=Athelia psychrophila TaxID=1759441 RepID=A0A167V1I6_9AGAM|nr:hypothetical protein FIBSPDRAFT_398026 [Fibularhizoctonia sp. CBS 109695]